MSPTDRVDVSAHELALLFARINDAPDELHSDITPAVTALIDLGWRVVPGLLDLMLATSPETRLHAQRAFEGILAREAGFEAGRGFARDSEEAALRERWVRLGDYAFDAPADRRAQAVAAWRRWFDERCGKRTS